VVVELASSSRFSPLFCFNLKGIGGGGIFILSMLPENTLFPILKGISGSGTSL